jgi:hypothetical protein
MIDRLCGVELGQRIKRQQQALVDFVRAVWWRGLEEQRQLVRARTSSTSGTDTA